MIWGVGPPHLRWHFSAHQFHFMPLFVNFSQQRPFMLFLHLCSKAFKMGKNVWRNEEIFAQEIVEFLLGIDFYDSFRSFWMFSTLSEGSFSLNYHFFLLRKALRYSNYDYSKVFGLKNADRLVTINWAAESLTYNINFENISMGNTVPSCCSEGPERHISDLISLTLKPFKCSSQLSFDPFGSICRDENGGSWQMS